MEGWAGQVSVDHSFAVAWDAGVMLASQRTWWRIAAEIEEQMLRPTIPTKRGNKNGRSAQKPVLKATGPCQIWSWDITDVYSPWRGKAFKVYSIMDIFSRQIVGWRVEDREADHLAVDMFETARTYIGDYVPWYNTKHKHSGIALFSPSQVHDGSWKDAWKTRDHALQDYYDKNPGRFRQRPTTPTPAGHVGINLPETKPAKLTA
jgi:transposase InsO family protein